MPCMMLLYRSYWVACLLLKWPCCYSTAYMCVYTWESLCSVALSCGHHVPHEPGAPDGSFRYREGELFHFLSIKLGEGNFMLCVAWIANRQLFRFIYMTSFPGSLSPLGHLGRTSCWDLPHLIPCPFPPEEWVTHFYGDRDPKQLCVHWNRGMVNHVNEGQGVTEVDVGSAVGVLLKEWPLDLAALCTFQEGRSCLSYW